MARDLAKEFGNFWKGGSYLFTQTPKEETISVKWRSGTVADYPRKDLRLMKSDSQVLEIIDNATGEILFLRDNGISPEIQEHYRKLGEHYNSTGKVTDLK